ncbi:MAG TPA: META domain-containing protein [Burkholderiaceae bacterium]|nr:META domain-containing protein [Burkholderiaceae bacterium]
MNIPGNKSTAIAGPVAKTRLRPLYGALVAILGILPNVALSAPAPERLELSQSAISSVPADNVPAAMEEPDFLNATYTIDDVPVTLKNGVSQVPAAPGSAAQETTRYLDNEVHKDLLGDGQDGIAFLLTRQGGGSGTFYYLVAALKKQGGLVGSHGFLLGDRITPQEVVSGPGRSIVVRYADHAPGVGLALPASVEKSVQLELDPQTLRFREVGPSEATKAVSLELTAGGKRWIWRLATYGDGTRIEPRVPEKFTLTFSPDGTFAATTDCNALSGSYTAEKNELSFGPIASTRMFCEGSQEQDFQELLAQVHAYHFGPNGELVLDLKVKSGTAQFR